VPKRSRSEDAPVGMIRAVSRDVPEKGSGVCGGSFIALLRDYLLRGRCLMRVEFKLVSKTRMGEIVVSLTLFIGSNVCIFTGLIVKYRINC